MSQGCPQYEVGVHQEATGAPEGRSTIMKDDFSFGWEYRARATELQDIAAMDRLAAQAAPASALRRYAASLTVRRDGRNRVWWRRLPGQSSQRRGAGARS